MNINELNLLENNLKKLNKSSHIDKNDDSYQLCDDAACFAEIFPKQKLVKCYEQVNADFFDAIEPLAKAHNLLFINCDMDKPVDAYKCCVPELLKSMKRKF